MKRTSDVTILGTVVYGVSISTTTFTLRSRTSLGSTQMNNQSKASQSDRYWVMTSEKRSPTYVVYHFDTQRLSPTRVCKKLKSFFAFTNFLIRLPRFEPVAPNRLRLLGKHGMHSPNSLTICVYPTLMKILIVCVRSLNFLNGFES